MKKDAFLFPCLCLSICCCCCVLVPGSVLLGIYSQYSDYEEADGRVINVAFCDGSPTEVEYYTDYPSWAPAPTFSSPPSMIPTLSSSPTTTSKPSPAPSSFSIPSVLSSMISTSTPTLTPSTNAEGSPGTNRDRKLLKGTSKRSLMTDLENPELRRRRIKKSYGGGYRHTGSTGRSSSSSSSSSSTTEYKITYEFQAEDGEFYQARGKSCQSSIPPLNSTVWILYDPLNPNGSVTERDTAEFFSSTGTTMTTFGILCCLLFCGCAYASYRYKKDPENKLSANNTSSYPPSQQQEVPSYQPQTTMAYSSQSAYTPQTTATGYNNSGANSSAYPPPPSYAPQANTTGYDSGTNTTTSPYGNLQPATTGLAYQGGVTGATNGPVTTTYQAP